MNVLQRKMSAEGDLVNNSGRTPFDPPEFQKYELSASIESTPEGAFVYVERNPRGEVVTQEIINTNLSPTGDPAEAYKVQARNQGLKFSKDLLLTGAGLYGGTGLLRGIGSKIADKIGPSIPGILGKKYSPFSLTKKPGQSVPGQKGFQPRDPEKIGSYSVGLKPNVATGAAVAGGVTALSAAEVTEQDIENEIKELEAQQSILQTKPQTQKQIDEENVERDAEFEVITSGEKDDEEAKKQKEEQDRLETEQRTPEQKQASIFASKNFSDLIRNIGIKMVETGDIGYGIAQGSALTAEEEKAAEAAAGEISEFDEFLAKERIKNTAPDKIASQTAKLAESVSDYEQGQITLQMFESVLEIMTKDDITGFGPIVKSIGNQIAGFFNPDVPLSPRERAVIVLEQIANGNIKTITGESGRTISNVDRQIAQRLVGDLKDPRTRETAVREKIETQIKSVEQRSAKALNEYQATTLYFTQNGLQVPLAPKDFTRATPDEEGRVRLKLN